MEILRKETVCELYKKLPIKKATVKLLTIFFRASAGCVYMTNDRFTVALQYADTSIANNLDDIMSYVNNTGMVGFY